MTVSPELQGLVRRVGREIRWRRAEFYGLRGAFYGALVGLVPLLLKGGLGSVAAPLAVGGALAGAALGVLRGVTRALPEGDVARVIDRAFRLRDRLATALEWAPRGDGGALVALLLADVAARLEGADGRGVVGRRWAREARLLPLPLLAMLVVALAPPIPLPTEGLPAWSSRDEAREAEDRPPGALSDERPLAGKREPPRLAEVMERAFALRGERRGPTHPGDLTALFKDTALASQRPDFQSFLKKGDERLRLLEQVDRLPDLQRDFTQSQYKVMFQRRKELFGGLRPDQIPPEKLRQLLEEMERMGRKGGWGGDIGEGMEALDAGQADRAWEAMERALSKMRALEARGRAGRGLSGGREDGRRRGRDGFGAGSEADTDFGGSEGLLPGRGRNPSPKGDPSDRLQANPLDAGVEGQPRQGRKEGYDTNLLGRGGAVPSRLQYLGVFAQYRKLMEEAMVREQVPREYQSQVKEYFDSLEERR